MAQYVLTGAVLLVCTYTDLQKRKIYKSVLILHLAMALFLHLMREDLTADYVLIGFLPGLACLLLAVVTNQAMGYGDALLVITSGISLGLEQELSILLTAFWGAGIWAVLLLVFRSAKRNSEIPFVPFLTVGTIIQVLEVMLQ